MSKTPANFTTSASPSSALVSQFMDSITIVFAAHFVIEDWVGICYELQSNHSRTDIVLVHLNVENTN